MFEGTELKKDFQKYFSNVKICENILERHDFRAYVSWSVFDQLKTSQLYINFQITLSLSKTNVQQTEMIMVSTVLLDHQS